MNTDRELLELAAKVVGIEGYIHEWINGPEFIIPGESPVTWNPLSDDADALRLAVKLKMCVHVRMGGVSVVVCDEYGEAPSSSSEAWVYVDAEHICIESATRRAITRAAAEIGKSI